MRLERFRVSNYRSVKDSGWIDLSQRTVLVGRNESGKSNVLLALASLKRPGQLEALPVARDFPADRSRAEYRPDLEVVRTIWSLTGPEQAELAELWPAARGVTLVEVGRGYDPTCWVRFQGVTDGEPLADAAAAAVAPEPAPVALEVEAVEEPGRPEVAAVALEDDDEVGTFFAGLSDEEAKPAPVAAVPAAPAAILDEADVAVTADPIDVDEEKAARDWVLSRLPSFLYLDDYPEVEGNTNLSDFVRMRQEKRLEPRHQYFEKLLTVAGIEPDSIDALIGADPDTRRQIVNHAGRVITSKLRQMWTDRALKVRFDLDGDNFNTLVSDPNSIYDVEINLNQRSRGFRWFFSFYVAFAALSKSEAAPILLLDEPGMHLHAVGQRDLLNHLVTDFESQVLLATQSPFLVPTDDLSGVRTVTISEQTGTRVSNSPAGDTATMIPLVHALGAEVAKGLLEGSWSLVVEGVTDYWYLLAVSNVLRDAGKTPLPSQLSITPAGNSATVIRMTGLLSAGGIPAIVLETGARSAEGPTDLASWDHVVSIADALGGGLPGGDVEDLFDPDTYDRFVRLAHKSQLETQGYDLDASIPQAVARYEDAFARAGLEFSRSKVARVFVRAMLTNPDTALPAESRDRFERLFVLVQQRLQVLRGQAAAQQEPRDAWN